MDIIQKPAVVSRAFFADATSRIVEAVRVAAAARPFLPSRSMQPHAPPVPHVRARPFAPNRVIVVGASTGGAEAIRVLLRSFDPSSPGTVVVQHMPTGFTARFAQRLDQISAVRVKEAESGDRVRSGHVLIAQADRHVVIARDVEGYYVEVVDGPPVNRHRPSVDVLFHSAATECGPDAVGVIMTGMGDDGARGLRALRDAGARTLGQDEASCVVYGMPKEAVRHGGVETVMSLGTLGNGVLDACG